MHVVERYTVSDHRKSMTGTVSADDPATFTSSWSASQRFILHNQPISEAENVCAENNDASRTSESHQ